MPLISKRLLHMLFLDFAPPHNDNVETILCIPLQRLIFLGCFTTASMANSCRTGRRGSSNAILGIISGLDGTAGTEKIQVTISWERLDVERVYEDVKERIENCGTYYHPGG
jgi:hypothetical protein